MNKGLVQIDPKTLTGPRSYFTDLAPFDSDYSPVAAIRNLKLQLLTKKIVIIAASALFHDIGYQLFSNHEGLSESLEHGIIVPAIRDEFRNIASFYDAHFEKGYTKDSRDFFLNHVAHSVPWNLHENSNWFKTNIYKELRRHNSLVRKQIGFSSPQVEELISSIEKQIEESPDSRKFLRIEYVLKACSGLSEKAALCICNFSKLAYRLSGSRVVKSDPHFPETQLLTLKDAEKYLEITDESIFWDIYVESVLSFLSTAIRLTTERLDSLSFKDILSIRKSLLDHDFIKEYDSLVELGKEGLKFENPDDLISKQEQINQAVRRLRFLFDERIRFELSAKDHKSREKALWQVANLISQFTPAGPVMSVLSNLQSIPEITTLLSRKTADAMQSRLQFIRKVINSKSKWSEKQKRTLLDGYRELVEYGLPQY